MMQAPFLDNPQEMYSRIAPLGAAVLLDSGGNEQRGRWDILAASPDPEFALYLPPELDTASLRTALRQWMQRLEPLCREPSLSDAPFQGGVIGFFSYELGRRLMGLSPDPRHTLPLAVARYYPWALVQDREHQRTEVVGDLAAAEASGLPDALHADAPEPPALRLESAFTGNWNFADYDSVFRQVQEYIQAGDCYQINLGQCFSAAFGGDLQRAYAALRPIARAPYSAYLPLGPQQALISLSPERFLTVSERRVETRPIKGTRPRSSDRSRDQASARELRGSEKERAENLMIVDLLRNDIGRYCRPGSVTVDELFEVESYATVHHLVSVVRGELSDDYSPLELLLGCMPGGSITGAPKRRAMQIIDQLEPAARQAWCGSIFHYSRHGRLDSNISIRTLFSDQGTLHCWAGGGLVADSEAPHEFQEQLDKVGAFLHTLEREFGPG